uniref:Peptidoglycan recognition protein family domain-containing protein n=1 Tax=Glossina brevipalpis TaxID=37001 RepID=A0A1A9W4K3_9MUSC
MTQESYSKMKGGDIQHSRSYGSLDNNFISPVTSIRIENDDEKTPLLTNRCHSVGVFDEYVYDNERYNDLSLLTSINSLNDDNATTATLISTVPEARKNVETCHWELRLVAFIFLLFTSVTLATYLLVIESRLPAITFSLDLISHDIWSKIQVTSENRNSYENITKIILMQTGGKNCFTPTSCLEILREMQLSYNKEGFELPYNFLIGGDGQTYEVRGWEYANGMTGVSQKDSLLIGLIGDFTNSIPNTKLLTTIRSLIKESLKRHKIHQKYRIYGLRNVSQQQQQQTKESSEVEGEKLFAEIMKWSEFENIFFI